MPLEAETDIERFSCAMCAEFGDRVDEIALRHIAEAEIARPDVSLIWRRIAASIHIMRTEAAGGEALAHRTPRKML